MHGLIKRYQGQSSNVLSCRYERLWDLAAQVLYYKLEEVFRMKVGFIGIGIACCGCTHLRLLDSLYLFVKLSDCTVYRVRLYNARRKRIQCCQKSDCKQADTDYSTHCICLFAWFSFTVRKSDYAIYPLFYKVKQFFKQIEYCFQGSFNS